MINSILTLMTSHFAVGAGCKPAYFFGLKPWYIYLDTNAQCEVTNFQVLGGTSGSDFLLVGLAIIDDLLRIAGMVTIIMVIYGGILYITSQGSPDATSKARATIQNGLIGLAIAILAIALVSFLGTKVG